MGASPAFGLVFASLGPLALGPHPRYSRRMQYRVAVVLCVLLALAGCGTVVDHHDVTLSISDPSNRLGAPVEGAILERTSSEALAPEAKKRLAPLPVRQEVTGTRVVAGLSAGNAPSVDLAFFVPKLAPDGYFFATLTPEEDREQRIDAKLVHFGAYFPDEGAMSIPLRYSGKGTSKGWTLNAVIDVQPQ